MTRSCGAQEQPAALQRAQGGDCGGHRQPVDHRRGPGNAPDNLGALELVERSEAVPERRWRKPWATRLWGRRGQTFADAGRRLVAKVPGRPDRKHFPKNDFHLDLAAGLHLSGRTGYRHSAGGKTDGWRRSCLSIAAFQFDGAVMSAALPVHRGPGSAGAAARALQQSAVLEPGTAPPTGPLRSRRHGQISWRAKSGCWAAADVLAVVCGGALSGSANYGTAIPLPDQDPRFLARLPTPSSGCSPPPNGRPPGKRRRTAGPRPRRYASRYGLAGGTGREKSGSTSREVRQNPNHRSHVRHHRLLGPIGQCA